MLEKPAWVDYRDGDLSDPSLFTKRIDVFKNELPNLIVDPDGTVHYRCPVIDENKFIRQWIEESDIEGFWYDGIFYFKNKEDRNMVKILL